jgi:hypothetical protein
MVTDEKMRALSRKLSISLERGRCTVRLEEALCIILNSSCVVDITDCYRSIDERLFHTEVPRYYELRQYNTEEGQQCFEDRVGYSSVELEMTDKMWKIAHARTATELTQLCRSVSARVLDDDDDGVLPPDDGSPFTTAVPHAAFQFVKRLLSIAQRSTPVYRIMKDSLRMEDRVTLDCQLRRIFHDRCPGTTFTAKDMLELTLLPDHPSRPSDWKEAALPLARRLLMHYKYLEDRRQPDPLDDVMINQPSGSNSPTTDAGEPSAAARRRPNRRGGCKARAKLERAANRSAAESSPTDVHTEPPPEPPPEPLPLRDDIQCPITMEPFEDPVMLVGDNCIYSRGAIEAWLRLNNTSPLHGSELDTQYKLKLIPLPAIAAKVERYRAAHPDL